MIMNDIETYNNEMRKSFYDKAFFLDHITDFKAFLDYGCADGSFIEYLREQLSIVRFAGYEIDKTEFELAREKLKKTPVNLFNNYNDLYKASRYLADKFVLNLSSVLHEVYSYSITKDYRPSAFWRSIYDLRPTYIVIRDMCVTENALYNSPNKDEVQKVYNFSDLAKIESFEKNWGPIKDNYKNFIHFLLKYRYTENWNREVKENYVPFTYQSLKKDLNMFNEKYDLVYEESFRVPFLEEKWEEDFGITLKYNTHIKLILKLKE